MTYLNDEQRRIIKQQQASNGLFDDYLSPAFDDIHAAVMTAILESESGRLTNRKLLLLQKEVTKAVNAGLSPAWESVTNDLYKVGISEASFLTATIAKYTSDKLKTPTNKAIIETIDKSILTLDSGGAGVWEQFVTKNKAGFAQKYNNIISADYAKRMALESTAPSLQQTSKTLRQLNTNLNKTSAETLVRTGMNHFSTEARKTVRDENLDIVAREVPFVTFDNRTSDTCISISAKYPNGWVVGKSPIGYPPYHYGCRTVILLMTKGQESLQGTRQALGGVDGGGEEFAAKKGRLRTKSQVTYGGRKDANIFEAETLAANTNFGQFLKTQPDYFVYDTLGVTKGRMFLDGKLDLKRLTDVRLKPVKVADL